MHLLMLHTYLLYYAFTAHSASVPPLSLSSLSLHLSLLSCTSPPCVQWLSVLLLAGILFLPLPCLPRSTFIFKETRIADALQNATAALCVCACFCVYMCLNAFSWSGAEPSEASVSEDA